MYNSKVLLGITGSIAAYKSAYLISKLVQKGFEVRVVATESALKFIGKATLEGLTGNRVYTDSFEEGEMMSHISLVKWADITIVCPASGNTINKMAAGIADNLLTSLFLAHDWTKPYLIVPAMNTNMFEHPATKDAIKKIESWGAEVFPTAEGYLACGDIGKGKLLEPDEIFERILIAVSNKQKPEKKLKVLVTAGGTKEEVDGIRYFTNLSTGKTAAAVADYFLRRGHDVIYLYAQDAKIPSVKCRLIKYTDFKNLEVELKTILGTESFDAIIHNAAVSDYTPELIEINGQKFSIPLSQKIDSENKRLTIILRKNQKLIDRLKEYSKNIKLTVVGFKFTSSEDVFIRNEAVEKLFKHSGCDYVVLNDKRNRDENNMQNNFAIYDNINKLQDCSTSFELAQELEKILIKK